jgi:hypothetical protein
MHKRITRPSLLPSAGIKNFFVAAEELRTSALAQEPLPSQMTSGSARLVTVPAKNPWFDTGIRVQMGEAYLLNVRTGQTWTDWYITCGPEGKTTFIQALGLPWLRVRRDDDGKAAYFFTLRAAIVNLNSPRVLVQTRASEVR